VVVDDTDYGCQTLDKACDAIQGRLGLYSGLKAQTLYVCPECLHSKMTTTGMSEDDLIAKKHKRVGDGVVCVTCNSNHEVEIYKWLGDYKRTKCRQHGSTHHDYFISYRVVTEGERGNNLSNDLFTELQSDGTSLCYLDHKCLQKGEFWKDGFLFGIGHSDVLVITISKGSIDIINDNAAKGNQNNDNVLLEIIRALEYRIEGRAKKVIPVLVANDKGFNFFNFAYYSDAAIAFKGKDSVKTIRDVMKELFNLQVIFVTAGDLLSIRTCVDEIRMCVAKK
jgi:hypothetical protein